MLRSSPFFPGIGGNSAGGRLERSPIKTLPTFPASPTACAIGDGDLRGHVCDKPDDVLGTAAKMALGTRVEAIRL